MNATIKSLESLISEIEAELVRLDACDSETNCSGIEVYEDDGKPGDLPSGGVRLSDGTGCAYGPASEILDALKGANADDATDYDGEPSGWHAAWEALGSFADSPPRNSQDWPGDLFSAKPYDPEAPNHPNANPITVVRIETNSGSRWTVGPHGASECAIDSAFEYDGWRESEEEASAAWERLSSVDACDSDA